MNKQSIYITFTILFSAFTMLQAVPSAENSTNEDGVDRGTITGSIAEEGTKDPMVYTTIAIYTLEDSSLVGGTVSDENGNFEIRKLPYGQYYIETDYVGYNKKVIQPIVLGSDSRKIDLGLLEMTINTQTIDEIEIIADRKHVEYRLDKKIINVSQDINAAGGTAVDVLENTPSVSVDIEGNVSLRGSTGFTVLIDGKPSVLEGSDALQQIPASAIENIEIITNPSAKYDPDGDAGIINVVMKRKIGKGTTGIVNASVGINNKYRTDLLLNRRTGKWNYFFGGSYNNNLYAGNLTREQETYTDSLTSSLYADGKFDFIRSGLQLKGGVSYDITEKAILSLEATGGNSEFTMDRSNRSYAYTNPSTEDTYYNSSSINSRNRKFYSLNANYTQTFDTKEHKLITMAYFSQNRGDAVSNQDDYNTGPDYDTDEVLPESSRTTEPSEEYEVRFQMDYSQPVGELGKLELGYQARIENELEEYLFENYDHDSQEWIENPLFTSDLDYFRNIQSAYATYGGEVGGFQYQLGMRGEYTFRRLDQENSDEDYLINRMSFYPTVHLAKEFKDDQQLMLSYSKRVSRPRGYYLDPNVTYVDPYTVRIGNPGLQPEDIHSVELGYQKGWEANFLAVELYYRNTRNLITRVSTYNDSLDLFIMGTENLNNDHSAGAEVMVNWKFWKFLTVNGSFSPYYYSINGEVNDEPIDQETFSWRSNLNATFQITPTTRLQTNMAYRSKSITAQGTVNGYYYMNLALRQDFFKRKLSAILSYRDIFGSIKRDMTNYGENFSQRILMVREPRVLTLTLSYKINNYRYNPNDRGGGSGGMEFDAGF